MCSNDTMDLAVACAEQRLVSNLATGVQFLGKESRYSKVWSIIITQVSDEI